MIFTLDINILPEPRLIGRIAFNKPWIHFSRLTNEFVIYIIKSGEMFIKEGEHEFILRKGDLLILEPSILHKGYREAACDYYYIHFSHPGIFMENNKKHDEIINEMILKRKISLTSDLLFEQSPMETNCYIPKYYHLENEGIFFNALNEALDEYYKKYENYKKIVSCRLLDLLIRVSREYITSNIENHQKNFPKAYLKVRKILDYLNYNYQNKISSKDISLLLDSNYNYLNRIFQRVTGYTIFQYLNIIRVEKAKEFISTTTLSFSEIGYLVGIDDPYYFSKLFKKAAGITPTQYYTSTVQA